MKHLLGSSSVMYILGQMFDTSIVSQNCMNLTNSGYESS
jgi:hypothetical protein